MQVSVPVKPWQNVVVEIRSSHCKAVPMAASREASSQDLPSDPSFTEMTWLDHLQKKVCNYTRDNLWMSMVHPTLHNNHTVFSGNNLQTHFSAKSFITPDSNWSWNGWLSEAFLRQTKGTRSKDRKWNLGSNFSAFICSHLSLRTTPSHIPHPTKDANLL